MANEKNLSPRDYFYGEPKRRHNIMLTDTAWSNFEKAAKDRGISISEFIERIGRKAMPVQEYKTFFKND